MVVNMTDTFFNRDLDFDDFCSKIEYNRRHMSAKSRIRTTVACLLRRRTSAQPKLACLVYITVVIEELYTLRVFPLHLNNLQA